MEEVQTIGVGEDGRLALGRGKIDCHYVARFGYRKGGAIDTFPITLKASLAGRFPFIAFDTASSFVILLAILIGGSTDGQPTCKSHSPSALSTCFHACAWGDGLGLASSFGIRIS